MSGCALAVTSAFISIQYQWGRIKVDIEDDFVIEQITEYWIRIAYI